MMDLISRRDHSEREIRQKLKGKFEPSEIDLAIEYGKERGWLPNSVESELALSEKAANELHRKKKGILYINAQLKEKGLPEVEGNPEQELEKAIELVKNKYSVPNDSTRDEKEKLKAKLGRFLISRGFDMSIVRKVIYEKLSR